MGKSNLETLFWLQLMNLGGPMPEPEYRFHQFRKWRVDFAWPSLRLAVELEGGVWTGGRHTRGSGFVADMEKYNALAAGGWRLLRFCGDSVRNGEAARQVAKMIGELAPPDAGGTFIDRPMTLEAFHDAVVDLTDELFPVAADSEDRQATADLGAVALALANASAALLILHRFEHGDSDAVRFCRLACASMFDDTKLH